MESLAESFSLGKIFMLNFLLVCANTICEVLEEKTGEDYGFDIVPFSYLPRFGLDENNLLLVIAPRDKLKVLAEVIDKREVIGDDMLEGVVFVVGNTNTMEVYFKVAGKGRGTDMVMRSLSKSRVEIEDKVRRRFLQSIRRLGEMYLSEITLHLN